MQKLISLFSTIVSLYFNKIISLHFIKLLCKLKLRFLNVTFETYSVYISVNFYFHIGMFSGQIGIDLNINPKPKNPKSLHYCKIIFLWRNLLADPDWLLANPPSELQASNHGRKQMSLYVHASNLLRKIFSAAIYSPGMYTLSTFNAYYNVECYIEVTKAFFTVFSLSSFE